MIHAVSLQTLEIDDIALACCELKEQLREKLTLLDHSLGIVQGHPEFIEAGVIEPLYHALGIPLVGGTTVSSATNDAVGSIMLSVLVITSDDVDFIVAHTQGFEEDCFLATENSLRSSLAIRPPSPEDPLKMVLVFPPVIDAIAGDDYIDAIEKVCGTAPIFGPLCVDDSLSSFDRSKTILNGDEWKREMTYVLFYGNLTPRFSVAMLPKESNLTGPGAVITKAKDNIVYEVNHMSAIAYFESIGLAEKGKVKDGALYVPLLMTPSNGKGSDTFVRAMVGINTDGSATFRGRMEEGAEFAFGSNNGADVLSSTEGIIARIAQEENVNAALLFSCFFRQLVIGANSLRELAQVKDTMPEGIPFLSSYSGGEISPTGVEKENEALNRFHNYSLIACLL